MEVAPRLSREAQAQNARQRRYDDEQLTARYYGDVQGPLEKSASVLEQRLMYGNMRWSRVAGTVLERYVTKNLPVAKPQVGEIESTKERQDA